MIKIIKKFLNRNKGAIVKFENNEQFQTYIINLLIYNGFKPLHTNRSAYGCRAILMGRKKRVDVDRCWISVYADGNTISEINKNSYGHLFYTQAKFIEHLEVEIGSLKLFIKE